MEHLLSGQKDAVFVKVKAEPGEAQLTGADLQSNAQKQAEGVATCKLLSTIVYQQ